MQKYPNRQALDLVKCIWILLVILPQISCSLVTQKNSCMELKQYNLDSNGMFLNASEVRDWHSILQPFNPKYAHLYKEDQCKIPPEYNNTFYKIYREYERYSGTSLDLLKLLSVLDHFVLKESYKHDLLMYLVFVQDCMYSHVVLNTITLYILHYLTDMISVYLSNSQNVLFVAKDINIKKELSSLKNQIENVLYKDYDCLISSYFKRLILEFIASNFNNTGAIFNYIDTFTEYHELLLFMKAIKKLYLWSITQHKNMISIHMYYKVNFFPSLEAELDHLPKYSIYPGITLNIDDLNYLKDLINVCSRGCLNSIYSVYNIPAVHILYERIPSNETDNTTLNSATPSYHKTFNIRIKTSSMLVNLLLLFRIADNGKIHTTNLLPCNYDKISIDFLEHEWTPLQLTKKTADLYIKVLAKIYMCICKEKEIPLTVCNIHLPMSYKLPEYNTQVMGAAQAAKYKTYLMIIYRLILNAHDTKIAKTVYRDNNTLYQSPAIDMSVFYEIK
ncbi:hypothetical protein NEOKW01_2016 [Nematocida sp. AWRm80]|nr:hypothetical protein NEOKW01_2016 [Nematocida sp. AWRm80]